MIYKELAKIPVPTGAEFLRTHWDLEPSPTTIQIFYSVTDFTQNAKRQMSKYLTFSLPFESNTVALATNPEDTLGVVLQRNSPSQKKHAILRKVLNVNGESSTSRIVEIWKEGLLEASLDVTDLHGDFYADEFLGSLEFTPSELALVYVAERKASSRDDKDPYQKYRFNPDFGEGLVGKCTPAIFLLRWSPSIPPSLSRLNIAGFEDVRFGQPIFDPKYSNVLYATGYELTKDGRALGIKFCFNRPSGIWRLTIPEPSLAEEDPINSTTHAVIDIDVDVLQKLTSAHLSCRSPRVLDTGERSILIWLACTCGGAHVSTSTLHILDITLASNQVDHKTLIAAQTPLVGIVQEPLKDTNTFPGLYPSYNIAFSPFISYVNNEHGILLTSQWGSRTTILRVHLKDGNVQEVTPVVDGNLYSWTMLATDGGETFVCSRSAPDVPYEILLGRFRRNGKVDWLLLDKPIMHRDVAEALERIKTEVISIADRGLVESIIVKSESSNQIGILPPCVTSIHGGPHVGSTTSFVPSTSALAIEGYTVSLPNYTGSMGYGEAFLQALIGKCGELDVADCIATAKHLCKLGISEEGRGKQLIMGGSHGGFLTAHLIGKFPSFFSAAVLRNPVISVGDLSSTDIPDWYYSEFGLPYPLSSTPLGPTTEPPSLPSPMTPEIYAKLRASSPIAHVDQVTAPVLLLIGKADRRVSPTHGIEFYHALKATSVLNGNRKGRIEMLWFDGEGHSLDGVETAKVSFEATVDWFAQAKRQVG